MEYEPILVTARKRGKSTGLITTATVSHATPAGFAANQDWRGNEQGVCMQYLEREIDVLLGGGFTNFNPERRDDGLDLVAEFKTAGYAYAEDTATMQQQAQTAERLLGLFATWFMPFEVDRLHAKDNAPDKTIPHLAEMTRAGLQVLNRNPEGFVVQIEGARVDHAAHANDASGLLFDQIAFDDTIQVALEFAQENSDTLIIITTDHGNANPGLSSGPRRGASTFRLLNEFKCAQRTLVDQHLRARQSPEEIQEQVARYTSVELTSEEARLMHRQLNEDLPVAYRRMNNNRAVLGQLLANQTDIGWIGDQHTSDHVELAALGPGSEKIKAFMKNTDLHTLMVECLG